MKQQKGITLIALVITIIVLLILAGVTIAMLSGDNSAPQKATEAAQKDAIAAAKDEIAMTVQESLLTFYDSKYVSATSNTATEAATTGVTTTVNNAVDTALTNVKKRNSELLAATARTNTSINLETKSFKCTGTIATNGGIEWGPITNK